jgi:hypothetical protein
MTTHLKKGMSLNTSQMVTLDKYENNEQQCVSLGLPCLPHCGHEPNEKADYPRTPFIQWLINQ